MFSRFFFQSSPNEDDDISAEDASMIKTILQFKDEFQSSYKPLIMTQDGFKSAGQIYYTNKFKNLYWTSDMNQELPIKSNDPPLWKKSAESIFEQQKGLTTQTNSSQNKEETKDYSDFKLDGKDIFTHMQEIYKYQYGSEKPITLCEAFVRKYLNTKKSQVCMQIRRLNDEAQLILENLHQSQKNQSLDHLNKKEKIVQKQGSSDSENQSPIRSINQEKNEQIFKKIYKNSKMVKYTWSDFFLQSIAFAKALVASNVPPRSCITIQGFNTPEHFMAIMGTICADCIFSDQYSTNSSQACFQQIQHSGSNLIVCDTWQTLKEKYLVNEQQLFEIGVRIAVIYSEFGQQSRGEVKSLQQKSKKQQDKIKVYYWSEFLQQGEDIDNRVIIKLMVKQKPGNCCNLLYTSGTTADSKGVMLSHDNMSWFWEIKNRMELEQQHQQQSEKDGPAIALIQNFQDDVHQVSFLPMSHITAQMFDFTRLICNNRKVLITFAPPTALQQNLVDTFREAKPTELIAVPRVYEKLEQFIKMHWQHQQIFVKWLLKWARDRGFKNTEAQMIGERSPFGYNLSRVLVLDKIKKALGLDRIEKLFYGAAPLKYDTSEFFASLNMPITSIYGLTETSGAVTYQEFPNIQFNQNGMPLPGTKIKIFNSDEEGTGEICVKGRNVFMGYLKRDDENLEAFDVEGYFHTGDLGFLDEYGRLQITGRIKDIIITAGGDNVSPTPIEFRLKTLCPIISYCVLIGDQQKFLSMLITLKVSYDSFGRATEELDPNVQSFLFRKFNNSVPIKTIEQAKRSEDVLKFIQQKIDEINKQAQSRIHTVKKWHILDQEFTVDHGELTPTLKIKRKVIANIYKQEISNLYNERLARL